ncbi:MAG: DNA-directed RNA polymerase subunit P [Hadesarchaea archaeon YNP_N21]|nr:MAG: DNA-directed RNA polymerase subunit P [Hadesarchaea archaeon YNP_N21]
MTYRCGNCDRTFEKIEATGIRCPYCGYRILFKVRPDVVRKVKAR